MNIDAYLTVRMGSKRLNNKCFLDFGESNIIEHCIKRCINSNIRPIICTTNKKKDDIFNKVSKKFQIRIFRGSEKNKIKRWYDCSNYFNIEKFHTIDVDDPFFDPLAVRACMRLLKKCDLVLPSIVSRNGGASEGYSFSKEGIRKLYESLINYKFKDINNFDTEMIDEFIKLKSIKKLIFKGMHYEMKKESRLTLDYMEDYFFFLKLIDKYNYTTKRKIINKYLMKNLDLQNINIFLNKRWRQKQNKFKVYLK